MVIFEAFAPRILICCSFSETKWGNPRSFEYCYKLKLIYITIKTFTPVCSCLRHSFLFYCVDSSMCLIRPLLHLGCPGEAEIPVKLQTIYENFTKWVYSGPCGWTKFLLSRKRIEGILKWQFVLKCYKTLGLFAMNLYWSDLFKRVLCVLADQSREKLQGLRVCSSRN